MAVEVIDPARLHLLYRAQGIGEAEEGGGVTPGQSPATTSLALIRGGQCL